jgi:uncharacterized membrane protein
MKRTLLLTFLCLFCTVAVIAGKPVTVKSGKVSVLKTQSKSLLEIDYSSTKVGKLPLNEYLKERGDDYLKDWPRESETAASYFREQFNKKSKGTKITSDEEAASYKIVISPKFIDMGNAGSFFVTMAIGGSRKAGGVIMSGPIEIIDLATNKVVCVLYVDDVKGKGHPKDAIRMGMMYQELAKKMCKLKDK